MPSDVSGRLLKALTGNTTEMGRLQRQDTFNHIGLSRALHSERARHKGLEPTPDQHKNAAISTDVLSPLHCYVTEMAAPTHISEFSGTANGPGSAVQTIAF